MAASFDPYHKWLGIPPAEQPPHHYRLLGISPFEADPDVVEAAADQRMFHLRSFQAGQHAALSQKLLNETAAAKLCLLRPDRKAIYDAQLRQQMAGPPRPGADFAAPDSAQGGAVRGASGAGSEPAPLAAPSPEAASPEAAQGASWEADALDFSRSTPSYSKIATMPRSKSKLPLLLIVAAPIFGLVVVIVAINIFNGLDNGGDGGSQTNAALTGSARERNSSASGQSGSGTAAAQSPPKLVIDWPRSERSDGFVILDGKTYDVSRQPGSLEYRLSPSVHRLQLRRIGWLPIDVVVPPQIAGARFKFTPHWQPTAAAFDRDGLAAAHHGAALPGGDSLERPPLDDGPLGKTPLPNDASSAAKENPQRALKTRVPIPDMAARKKVLAELKDVLKTDYAHAKTPETQIDLARRLAGLAEQDVGRNPARGYVEASQALEFAVRQCDVELASQLVNGFDHHFAVDGWKLKATTLGQLAHTARTNEARARLAKAALDLVDRAIADDRFDVAVELATTGSFLSAQLKDIAVRDLAHSLSERARRVQKGAQDLQAARDALLVKPNDPAANLAVGKFECFLKQDWNRGLPLLVRGSDADLEALAKQELSAPANATDRLKLADAWWDLANKRGADKRAADPSTTAGKDDLAVKSLRARAAYWYQRAAAGLSGLDLAKAQKRATETEPATADTIALEAVYLDDMHEQAVNVGHGHLGKHGETGYIHPDHVKVRGVAPQHALSLHPPNSGSATVSYDLAGKYHSFSGIAAIMDDSQQMQAAVTFRIFGDDKLLWSSRPLRHGGEFQECAVRLIGIRTLKLEIACSGNSTGAYAVWVNPMLTK